MSTIKDLREKLQSEKFPLRNHYWGYNWLYRKPSIYITYALSKTAVSANIVSMWVIIAGIIASVLASLGHIYLAILFAYLNLLLDGVDGEIARLRNIFSLRGVYLDAINHMIVPGLFLIGLSVYLNYPVVALAALFWSAIKIIGKIENKIYFGAYLDNEAKYNLPQNTSELSIKENTHSPSMARRLIGLRYQFREFLIFLVTILLSQLLNILPETVLIYSIFLILQFIEEAYRGYFSIESRVTSLSSRRR
ncbi:MAG TPA: CDP-alcohol phosphatidyltransferase family protein [Candidatus Paceibacterota bacterium]